jgi:hypothetical protein
LLCYSFCCLRPGVETLSLSPSPILSSFVSFEVQVKPSLTRTTGS